MIISFQARQGSALASATGRGASAARLFERMPGIDDVVWSILSRTRAEDDPLRLVFTSAAPRSGNTVIAAATAIALVRQARVPVCLVEADFAEPALARYLGLRPEGLSDVLDGRLALDECLQSPRECPGLFVLPGGTPRAPISGELAAERMRAILDELDTRCGYLVLDAPCVLAHLEARALLQRAHAAVLVLRAGATSMDTATRAHEVLVEAHLPVLGSIFNAYGPERALARTEPYRLTDDELGGHTDDADATAPNTEFGFVLDPRANAAADEHAVAGPLALEPTPDAAHAGNGAPELEASETNGAAHRREVDVLERRIAKLMTQLAQTEADLRRIAAAKNIDLGIASVYRRVQGLSEEAEALESKQDLMRQIFETNLELKRATQRHT